MKYVKGHKLAIARWVLGLGIIAALLLRFDVSEIAAHLQKADWRLALPALLGLTAVHLVGAGAWKALAAQMAGMRLGWRYAARAYYAAQAVGGFTPGHVGADFYLAYALRGSNGSTWRAGLSPVLAQRVTSYLALLALGAGASFIIPLPTTVRLLLAGLSGSLLVMACAAYFLLPRTPESQSEVPVVGADGVRPRPDSRRPLRFRIAARLPVRRERLPRALVTGLLLALVFHIVSVGLALVLVQSLGARGNALPALAAILLARLAIMLPITVNGLGLQEAALVLLFPLVGITAEVAVAVSLLNRLALLLTMVLGGISLSLGRPQPHKTAEEAAPTSSRVRPVL